MTGNAENRGCLASLLALLLYVVWSGVLSVHILLTVLSSQVTEGFMVRGLQAYAREELGITDEEFLARLQKQARQQEQVPLLREFDIRLERAEILEAKDARSLYQLYASKLLQPLYAPDAASLSQGDNRLWEMLNSVTELNPRWKGKNLYSIRQDIRTWFMIGLLAGLVLLGSFLALTRGARRMRGPGILAVLAASPWMVLSFLLQKGPDWLVRLQVLEEDFPRGLFEAVRSAYRESTVLSQWSFWGGLGLIALSVLVVVQAREEDPARKTD